MSSCDELNIGIDVGGTNTKIAVVKADGGIVQKISVPTVKSKKNDLLLDCIIENTKQLLRESGLSLADINSIGLGIPGTVDIAQGKILYAPNIFLKDMEIVKPIKKAFNHKIFLAQDSRASAWAEYLVGSGKGFCDIVSITLGTGIGCGMIINRKIFNGGLNTAGEFGHQIIDINGFKCNCGKRGCLETFIGGPAILRNALLNKNLNEKLKEISREVVTVADFYKLAEKGDDDAKQLTNNVVRYLAHGLVNLINIMSPQLICISGGISNANDRLLFEPLKKLVRQTIYEPINNKLKIVKSVLCDNAPLIGASLLYKQEY